MTRTTQAWLIAALFLAGCPARIGPPALPSTPPPPATKPKATPSATPEPLIKAEPSITPRVVATPTPAPPLVLPSAFPSVLVPAFAAKALSGRVVLPAMLISDHGAMVVSNNGGILVTDNGAGYKLAQAGIAPAIEVGLVDAAGALLPGTAWAKADAEGRYAFDAVPEPAGFLLQARVTAGQDAWRFSGLGKLAGATGTAIDVDAASTLVAEKARVVLAEQDQALSSFGFAGLPPLLLTVSNQLPAPEKLDFRLQSAPEALVTALDVKLQEVPELLVRAREVDLNVGTVRPKVKQPFAEDIGSPEQVAYDQWGNLFVAGLDDHTLYMVPAGTRDLEVFYDGEDLQFPHGVACAADGSVYVSRRIDVPRKTGDNQTDYDRPGKQVYRIDEDGETLTPLNYTFDAPAGMCMAADGKTLLVTSYEGGDLVAYDTQTNTGRVLAKGLRYGLGVAVDSLGTAYVTHLRYREEKQDFIGCITTVTPEGATDLFYAGEDGVTGSDRLEAIAVDAADNLYVTNNWGNTIFKFTPKRKKIETFLKFSQPTGIALDPRGNLVVADYLAGTLSKVTP